MSKNYYIYILTNKIDTVLYIGVTKNLKNRIGSHRNKQNKGFTQKYNVNKLVYYDAFNKIEEALEAEKKLKTGEDNGK
jgi:putative endonuclease